MFHFTKKQRTQNKKCTFFRNSYCWGCTVSPWHVYGTVLTPAPQDVTVCGETVFKEVTKLKVRSLQRALIECDRRPCKKDQGTGTWRKGRVNTDRGDSACRPRGGASETKTCPRLVLRLAASGLPSSCTHPDTSGMSQGNFS